MTDEFWAVTTLFNHTRSPIRASNYRRFRESLNLPLLTVELAQDGRFRLNDSDAEILHQISEADVMWQKERLLNLALDRLPRSCEYVAWLDADVLFRNRHWPAECIAALERHDYVQPFSRLDFLPPAATRTSAAGATPALGAQQGFGAAILSGGNPDRLIADLPLRDQGGTASGFAWTARRETLAAHGFYDRCIIGGGDSAFLAAVLGCCGVLKTIHHMSAAQRTAYQDWAQNVVSRHRLPIGCVEGKADHLWHGSLTSRKAQSRHVELAECDFDPDNDLVLSSEGCWMWTTAGRRMQQLMVEYFRFREAGSAAVESA